MNTMHSKTHLDIGLFNKIDINLYPLFVSIFEQKSISKAAQVLCISQSAASHALQRLRQHLQDDLFARAGSQMLPTPFAEQIYPSIKSALMAIQHISMQTQQFEPNMLQSLKIAVHDEIEPMVFPKLVAHFKQLDLDIQFISSKLDRKNMLADLATQQLDFVIDLEQHVSDKLQFDALVADHFVVCTQRNDMDKNIYFNSPHIGVSSRRSGILVEDIYLNRKQLSRQIFLRCQHYSTALQILQQQPDAMLTIPNNVLRHLQIPGGINIFDAPVDMPNIKMGMFWHKDLELNSRHSFLRSEINKIFA
jgi:DNA-binding transcriptional LysR family regulator